MTKTSAIAGVMTLQGAKEEKKFWGLPLLLFRNEIQFGYESCIFLRLKKQSSLYKEHWFCFLFWDRISMCNSGWAWAHYVTQAGLRRMVIVLSQSPKWQPCTTMPSLYKNTGKNKLVIILVLKWHHFCFFLLFCWLQRIPSCFMEYAWFYESLW